MVNKAYLELFGARPITASVSTPGNGIWTADVVIDGDVQVDLGVFKAVLRINETTFTGTYDPLHSGVFGFKRKLKIIGGAGGWSRRIPVHHFHNDAGIKLSTVVLHAANAVKERVSVATILDRRLGVDWVRLNAPASRTLYRLGVPWWVDYAGTTQVRVRQSTDATKFDLLDFSPSTRMVVLGAFDPGTVQPGMVIRDSRMPAPFVVHHTKIEVDHDKVRVYCWGV